MHIQPLTHIDDDVVQQFHRLLPQLSNDDLPTQATLREIVASPSTVVWVALDEAACIVGTLTLACYKTPSGAHFWIEDVVVDERARGHGVGEQLCKVAIAHAQTQGAKIVNLTSRPSREAANRLYVRLGFVRRETNVYKLTLS